MLLTLELPESINFNVHCCFCDKPVDKRATYVVCLVWPDKQQFLDDEPSEDIEQQWWCHRECFVNSLHPDYRIMRDEE